jgi:hypothetical protein
MNHSEVTLPPLATYTRKIYSLLADLDTLQRDLHPITTPTKQVIIDKRIKSFDLSKEKDANRSTPSVNRFPKPYRQKVGPGYYYSIAPLKDAGYVFGQAARFNDSLDDKISSNP